MTNPKTTNNKPAAAKTVAAKTAAKTAATRTAAKTAAKTAKVKSAAKTGAARKASKPATPTATELRMIALDRLVLSAHNVRKVQPSQADDAELLASIREEGIKQNLVVHEGDDGAFLVNAGGRRLKALQVLSDEGVIAADHPVACLVEDGSRATLSSTIENMHRQAMHGADEFEAFAAMIGEGRSEEDIARKFGVGVDKVRRRLKLARVAPDILEAFRQGDLTLECVMAFTLTDDHDRQMTVWNAIRDGYHVHAPSIRRMLTETSHSAGSRLGRFVGEAAYEAAGGTVMRDLFSDSASTWFEDAELVERLALEKLKRAASEYEKDWRWVDIHLELDHGALRSFGRVQRLEVDPDPDLLAELETLTAREEELAAMGDEGELSDELHEEYEGLEERIDALRDAIEQARPFAECDRKIAGVVLTIDWDGELVAKEGLVRPEDMPVADDGGDVDDDASRRVTSPTSSMPAPVSDPATALRKAEGLSNSLADDLRTSRHAILRAHLAADYGTAFDAMLYVLCKRAFASGYVSGLPLDVSLTRYHVPDGDKLVSGSVAGQMLETLEAGLDLDWMELDQPDDFRALCGLPADRKQALFAFAAAFALNGQLSTDNRPSSIIEELGMRLDVDIASCWRPTAANYWGSVTKAHIAAVAKDVVGEEFAAERASEKKAQAAAAMEQAFGEDAAEAVGLDGVIAARTASWLPKGMGFDAPRDGNVPTVGNAPCEGNVPTVGNAPSDGSVPIDGNVPIEGDASTTGDNTASGNDAAPVDDADLPAFVTEDAAA